MTCTYFHIIIHSTAYHHLQITWLSYFGSENQGLPLRSWFVTCWLWRHIPIVTSLAVPSSYVATQTPMGTNSGTRRRKRKFLLLFVNCDRGRIEIDHLYGLCCRGWYCNPEQHSLCRPARPQAAARRPAQLVLFRIAVPTTPAQTVSWSIGFRSRFSQCVDYMRFNEKSFCFRWQETTKLMLFCNTKTSSLVILCDLRYLTRNISSVMTKPMGVQRKLHRFAYLIVQIILCFYS